MHCLHPFNLNLKCGSRKVPSEGLRSLIFWSAALLSLSLLIFPTSVSLFSPLQSSLRPSDSPSREWDGCLSSALPEDRAVNTEGLSPWQAPKCSLTAFKHLEHTLGMLSHPQLHSPGCWCWHTPGILSNPLLTLEYWVTLSLQHSLNIKQLCTFTVSGGKRGDVAQNQSFCS